jgi:hypothetical protein
VTDEGELIAQRYRLVSRVGSGAMGVVWRAQDEVLRRTVAVKELLVHPGMSAAQTDEAHRRAMREGRIAARLQHPNAISVYDVVEHEGRPCLIMEFLPSRSLSDLIAARRVLPVDDVARMGGQIAAALSAAHDAGIVHRDVKPANVLLGGDGIAKLTDFGISRAVGDGTVTATGVLAGTPAYLAPEIAQGQDGGFPSDVFSLGSTLYTAVEGRPPFGLNDNPIAMLHRIATSELDPPRSAGPLTGALEWMLDRDPLRRPTARQVEQALAELAAATELTPTPVPAPTPTPASAPTPAPTPAPTETLTVPPANRRRRRLVLAGAVLAALLLVGGIIVVDLIGSSHQPASAGGAPTSTSRPATSSSPHPPSSGSSSPTSTTAALDLPGQLRAAIVDYYALVPNNLAAAWPGLTTSYQQAHAGGFSGYQQFWQPIQRVTVSNVVATAPASVVATIGYYYQDGRVVAESTSFGLAQENGQWKIASSSVLSSQSSQG